MKIKRFTLAVIFLGAAFLGGDLVPAGAQDVLVDFDQPFGVNNPFSDWEDNLAAIEPKSGKTLQEIISDTLKELGVGWVTDSVFRKTVEKLKYEYGQTFTSQPAYDDLVTLDFTFYDTLVGAYQAANTKILFVINPKSNWKITRNENNKYKLIKNNDGMQAPQSPPSLDFDYYRAYVTKLMDRYGDRAAGWFIFNEPADDYKSSEDRYDIQSYVNLVETTYPIIKARNPQAIVILGGSSAISKLDFYAKVLAELKDKRNDASSPCFQTGCFEVWDYHTYAVASEYSRIWTARNAWETAPDEYKQYRNETYRYFQIYRDMLDYHGFGDKPLITKEGGTYTGKDVTIEKPAGSNRKLLEQDEIDQASFLVKRAVLLLSKGLKLINWSTVLEHEEFQEEAHNFFNYIGLIYNGKKNGRIPDPVYFERKLSFYTYQSLIEKLRNARWDSFKQTGYYPISTMPGFGVSVYEFKNEQEERKFILWVDYYDYDNQNKPPLRSTLQLPVSVSVDIPDLSNREVKITKGVPERKNGEVVFETFFKSLDQNGNFTIDLNKEPLYIELAKPNNPPRIIPPIGGKTVNEGQLLNFIVSASDLDGDSLTYSASGLPPGASFNDHGTFLWRPDYSRGRAEDYKVIFTVSDGRGGIVNEEVFIKVRDVIDTVTLWTSVEKSGGKMKIKLYARSSLQSEAKLSYKLKDVKGLVLRQGALSFNPNLRQNYYYARIGGLAIASYKIEVASDKGGNAEITVNPK